MNELTKRICIVVALIAVAVIYGVLTSGCATAETLANGISQKSVSGSGTLIVSRAGLDKTNQTPELFSLFVWGDYTSVIAGDEVMRYEVTEDASIFNASAKTTKIKMFFSSGDKKRMDNFLNSINSDAMKRGQISTNTATEGK